MQERLKFRLTSLIIKSFELSKKVIIPIEIMHGKLKIFGFRIDKMAYITDAKTVSDKEKDKLKDLDVLIVNALRLETTCHSF